MSGRIGKEGLLNLGRDELAQTKRQVVDIVKRCEAHKAQMHYTQTPARWEGIADDILGVKGRFPAHGDCSAWTTWVIWSAVHEHLKAILHEDFVNGLGWDGGHTGSQVQNGRKVSLDNLRIGDLVFYGDEGWRPGHVAIYIGQGLVGSFGSEPGPFILPVRYRSDVGLWSPRRYFH